MEYRYKVYGLNIKSEIELNELVELEYEEWDKIDVNIKLGEMPLEVEKYILSGKKKVLEENLIWFRKENFAQFYIKNGNEIRIKLLENASLPYLKLYILGSCLSYILFQREVVAIHGGAMNIKDMGIIITGEKGAGKSSLTSSLRQRGYDLVADDLVSIDLGEDISINPAYPQQRLKSHTMKRLKYDKQKYNNIDGTSKTKYIIPVSNSFCKNKVRLNSIFNLVIGEVETVQIEEIKGHEKINIVIDNLFSAKVLKKIGLSNSYFKKCINLAKEIPVYKVIRPKDGFTVENQISIIEKSLKV